MCGIIGYIGYNKAFAFILKGLLMLQNRGYDSAGICTIDNTFTNHKYASELHTTKISALDKLKHDKQNHHGSIGIGHTRWATHGAKTDTNAHPHFSMDKKIVLVHNGIIENYEQLKEELINEHNIKFVSQTDTEVIVNLLSIFYEKHKNMEKAITKTINRLEGTWGLSIMCIDEPNTIYCIRHGSPILIGFGENFILVSSEQSGFCGNVQNYICLNDGDVAILKKENNMVLFETKCNYDLMNITTEDYSITPHPYPHWTIKEIYEQYDSSLRAISLGGRLLDDHKVKLGGLGENKSYLTNIEHLILLGCGTSYHAGLHSLFFFKDLCNFTTVQVFDGAEFTFDDLPKNGKTALILLSQSGETKDLHRCIKIGKDNDLFLIGVVNAVDSLIAREVNCGCYLNAGREVGVASTKSFTSQVIVLSMMAIWFAQINDISYNKRKQYITDLHKLPQDIKQTINNTEETCKTVIDILYDKNSCFVLGKGSLESISKEGALKMKELSYIHAEGYGGSSLRHGPYSLLVKNTPVFFVCPDDDNFMLMKSTMEEVLSREATPICITDTNRSMNNIKHIITVVKNNTYNGILHTIPMQLIAYYLALKKGHDPDFPRNLAKCVSV